MSDLVQLVQSAIAERIEEYDFDTWHLDEDLAEVDLLQVEGRTIIDERRWYNRVRLVYGQPDELEWFVAISWNEGSTELQDDGIEPDVKVELARAVPSVRYEVVK